MSATAAAAVAGEDTAVARAAASAAAEEPNDDEGEDDHPGAVVHGIAAAGLITRHIWIPPILIYRLCLPVHYILCRSKPKGADILGKMCRILSKLWLNKMNARDTI